MNRRTTSLLAVLLGLLLVSGCGGPTFSSLPLPGSGVSGDTMRVRADFGDALNLASGAIVKVNGLDSGRVRSVTVHDFHARVTMEVRRSAELRSGARARLRYTTPLGELFVDVTNPTTGARLPDDALLPRGSTSTAPTVEDALSESSMLVNGGGLAQLQTITSELNRALSGRTGTVRDLLRRSNTSLAALNASSADFDAALHALGDVSRLLDRRRRTIHRALQDVRPAAKVVHADLGRITRLLADLDDFASTANSVVDDTGDNLLRIARKAGPILQELSAQRKVLPATLRALLALAADLDRVLPTDYLNLGVHLKLDRFVAGTDTPLGPGSLQSTAKPGARDLADRVTDLLEHGLTGNADQPRTGQQGGSGGPGGDGGGLGELLSTLLGGLLGGGR